MPDEPCDLASSACSGDLVSYVLWVEGAYRATLVRACWIHSGPLRDLQNRGLAVDLPTRPRAKMEQTRLRTTPRTARLKKRRADGSKD